MTDEIMLGVYERAHARGDKEAALRALAHCFKNDIPPPQWTKDALAAALRAVRKLEVGSWDEVFGKPHKGRKLSHLRRERELRWTILQRVHAMRQERPRPHRDIFQAVAEEVGVSRGTCKRYFDNIFRFRKRPT